MVNMEKLGTSVLKIILKKYSVYILLLAIISGGITTFIVEKISPSQYIATNQVIISPKTNDAQMDLKYVSTYKELLTNEIILDKVHNNLKRSNINRSTHDLQKDLTILTDTDSQIVTIQVADNSKNESIKIVNAFGLVAQDELPKLITTNKSKLLNGTDQAYRIGNINKMQLMLITSTIFFVFYFLIIVRIIFKRNKLFFPEQVADILRTKRLYQFN